MLAHTGLVAAIGAGGFLLMLVLLVAVVTPVAAIAFSRSSKGFEQLGKGRFAVDFETATDDDREEEIRQLATARAWRRQSRGEDPGDLATEIERLLELEPGDGDGSAPAEGPAAPVPGPASSLRAEIRQVVIARNESRARRGEQPLDVEAEIERLLGDAG